MQVSTQGSSPHPFLVDLDFWRRRLRAMSEVPQRLLVYPRPDLSEPGVEVVELCLHAHDEVRLSGLLARSVFRRPDQPVRLRTIEELDPGDVSWDTVRTGEAELLLRIPVDRCLKDQVLDIVRACQAATRVDGIEGCAVLLDSPENSPVSDAVLIAGHLLEQEAG